MTFTLKTAFILGWRTFKARYISLLLACLITLLLALGASMVGTLAGALVVPWAGAITVFLALPLWPGLMLLATQNVRDESPSLKILFTGFTRYWPVLGIMLVLWLAPAMTFLFALPVMWLSAIGGFIVGYLFIVFFTIRLFFAPLLCVDPRRRLGFTESISTSWKLTAMPALWPLLGLFFISPLVSAVPAALLHLLQYPAVGVLFLLVYFFIGVPLFIAVIASAYHLLADGDAVTVTDDGDAGFD